MEVLAVVMLLLQSQDLTNMHVVNFIKYAIIQTIVKASVHSFLKVMKVKEK